MQTEASGYRLQVAAFLLCRAIPLEHERQSYSRPADEQCQQSYRRYKRGEATGVG